ncbi:MAG: hypothetical protein KAR25_06145, partial [Methanosarcinales archaeon]|nr:hypothetical protein [Methanosarcinales archaeon]
MVSYVYRKSREIILWQVCQYGTTEVTNFVHYPVNAPLFIVTALTPVLRSPSADIAQYPANNAPAPS